MHLTQVDTTYCVLTIKEVTSDTLAGNRINRCSLLNKPVKKLSSGTRSSSIETKSKLVKIIVQVRQLNSSLMGAQQPALEQGGNSVCQWQKVLANVRFLSDDLVDVAQSLQSRISYPVVSAHNRTRLNTLLDSRLQTFGRCVHHSPETDSPNPAAVLLSSNNHQGFACCPTTPFARPFASNISLVHLHDSRKTITSWSHHSVTKFMQPRPCRSVAPKTQDTLQPKGADALFLIRDIPNGSKPQLQWFSRILEYGSCCYRCLKMTILAFIKSLSNLPSLMMSTARTTKSIRPTKAIKVVSAGLFCAKLLLKFHQGLGIIFHTRQYYILGLPESSA